MDGLSLLRQARNAGLRLEAAGDKLKITGPKAAEPVVKLLAAHKAEVLAALANTPRETELLAQTPQFEQLAPLEETVPGLEQPCDARRGKVQHDGKIFLHFCIECGVPTVRLVMGSVCEPDKRGVGIVSNIGLEHRG